MDQGVDSNTRFFHNSVKANRNKILSITLKSGATIHEPAAFHSAAINHFHKLYNDDYPSEGTSPALNSFVFNAISPSQAADLIQRVTPEEIKATIF